MLIALPLGIVIGLISVVISKFESKPDSGKRPETLNKENHSSIEERRTTPVPEVTPPSAFIGEKLLHKTNENSDVEIPRAIPIVKPKPPLPPAQRSEIDSPPLRQSYSVVRVARGDMLKVRSGPGANNAISATLPDGYGKIHVIGTTVKNGTTEWVHIVFGDQSGWVNKQFLELEED